MIRRTAWLVLLLAASARSDDALLPTDDFRAEVARIAARPLGGIDSAEAWKAARPERQRQLREMLGLDPLPERTDLKAEVRRVVERPDFVVEAILFQSRPGLYVTANLYRPKVVSEPLPAILYVCGHGEVKKDGVIYGCKAHYQHHAAWYAANGYVCLILDTLQLGELPGLHHGTARYGMWWWQSLGYTPAGVEAWNGIRGIDYLASRPEVDPKRIGVTGRSGGGATSWWLGALDDRIAAVCPVAGITDLKDHVVEAPAPYPDGVIGGHCDCMYFVNSCRWDFDALAAHVAPKPLLVENTDHDPIFPEAGVRRIYGVLEKVYGWYDASDRLGLVIGKGGHADTEEIRHPSFAFFEKWLKGKREQDIRIEEPDRKVPIEELKVLRPGEVPPGCRNATIHESFVEPAQPSPTGTPASRAAVLDLVRREVFGGWPDDAGPVAITPRADRQHDGLRVRSFDLTTQPGARARLWLFTTPDDRPIRSVALEVLDPTRWAECSPALGAEPTGLPPFAAGDRPGDGQAFALLAPRGVGPNAWPADREVQVRRRFALLGQTLEGMQVWDARRAIQALGRVEGFGDAEVTIVGRGAPGTIAFWAAAFEPRVSGGTLDDQPTTFRDAPALLGLGRVHGLPLDPELVRPRHFRIRYRRAD